jgi:hypothetical protein
MGVAGRILRRAFSIGFVETEFRPGFAGDKPVGRRGMAQQPFGGKRPGEDNGEQKPGSSHGSF